MKNYIDEERSLALILNNQPSDFLELQASIPNLPHNYKPYNYLELALASYAEGEFQYFDETRQPVIDRVSVQGWQQFNFPADFDTSPYPNYNTELFAYRNPATGYYGVDFQQQNSQNIVIAHRGTDGGRDLSEVGPDYFNDGQILFNIVPSQAADALAFTQMVQQASGQRMSA